MLRWARVGSISNSTKKEQALCLLYRAGLEQVTGIEPASPPWQGGILPLNHTCTLNYSNRVTMKNQGEKYERIQPCQFNLSNY